MKPQSEAKSWMGFIGFIGTREAIGNPRPRICQTKSEPLTPTRAAYLPGSGSFSARPRPYSRSEVIHRAGDESLFPAFERERPRIVNNFAASAPSGYELSSTSEKMNSTRL